VRAALETRRAICKAIVKVQGVILALLLAAILGLLASSVQRVVRAAFERRRILLPVVTAALAVVFWGVLAVLGAWRWQLGLLIGIYFLAPSLLAWRLGTGEAKRPRALDFAIVLMLWLPLEFAAGAQWVPRPVQGAVHSVAYGFSILLALGIFLCYRGLDGMKYNPPRSGRDALYPLAGFALAAPVLFAVGLWLGFIPWFHRPSHGAGAMALRFLVIFVATALPEEILFRSLIQNLLTLRFGWNWRTLAAAALIFGSSHLNNGPAPGPNWRYAAIATVAGAAFGLVFRKSSTVLASAGLHAMVNATKYFFF